MPRTSKTYALPSSSVAPAVATTPISSTDFNVLTADLVTALNTAPPLKLSDFNATTSAELKTVISDETGTGALVFANTPALVTPDLGVATATSVNKVAITAPAASATLTIPDGVTLTGPAASGTAMTLGNAETITGAKTFGSAGAVGKLKVAGTTSGSTILDATAVASGTLTLPAATDTLVGKATTDTLTNKTLTSPTISTPAITSPTITSSFTATGLVTNAALANMAAYTLKGNATAGSAAPTDISIPALTQKVSPVSGDMILVADSAASNALKYALVSSIASAGSVSSIAGNTGAFTLSNGITNSTNDIRIDAATQADQETSTSTVKPVTPGRQQFHPSAAKAWVNFSGVTTVTQNASYNVGTVTRTGTGAYTIPFTVNFSSANYAVSHAVMFTTGGHAQFMRITTQTASGITVNALDNTFNPADADGLSFVFFGDQ